jgi:hypothetical protein
MNLILVFHVESHITMHEKILRKLLQKEKHIETIISKLRFKKVLFIQFDSMISRCTQKISIEKRK